MDDKQQQLEELRKAFVTAIAAGLTPDEIKRAIEAAIRQYKQKKAGGR